ncbi:MAG: hypothetical protein QE570_09805 [Verrucomicrobiota bacterium]|jgi:hypothetical protein|nr:hypothetical protein [Verrucomicrobiota bacterium]
MQTCKTHLILGCVFAHTSCSQQNLSPTASTPASELTWDTGPAMW